MRQFHAPATRAVRWEPAAVEIGELGHCRHVRTTTSTSGRGHDRDRCALAAGSTSGGPPQTADAILNDSIIPERRRRRRRLCAAQGRGCDARRRELRQRHDTHDKNMNDEDEDVDVDPDGLVPLYLRRMDRLRCWLCQTGGSGGGAARRWGISIDRRRRRGAGWGRLAAGSQSRRLLARRCSARIRHIFCLRWTTTPPRRRRSSRPCTLTHRRRSDCASADAYKALLRLLLLLDDASLCFSSNNPWTSSVYGLFLVACASSFVYLLPPSRRGYAISSVFVCHSLF